MSLRAWVAVFVAVVCVTGSPVGDPTAGGSGGDDVQLRQLILRDYERYVLQQTMGDIRDIVSERLGQLLDPAEFEVAFLEISRCIDVLVSLKANQPLPLH